MTITPSYIPLATITLPSTSTSVTFSNFPTNGTYTNLVLVINARNTGSLSGIELNFNNDANASNYYRIYMSAQGSTLSGSTDNTLTQFVFSNAEDSVNTMHIFDYSDTSKPTSFLTDQGLSEWGVRLYGGRWQNNAAVSSIKIYDVSGTSFTTGSIFSLYGVK